ncbi:Leucine-rich repeat receptor-like tyrosine-protein kinase PXC3-like protein [Drosera capensis]
MGLRYVVRLWAFVVVFVQLSAALSGLSLNQKATMDKLYELVHNQTSPGSSLSWSLSTDPCSWSGVSCGGATNSSIVELSLTNLGLSSSGFLPLVCEISSLESLDVSKNMLMSIPTEFLTNCGGLGGLKLLNFSLNRVPGLVPSFDGFSSLESLDLSYNVFSGSIGTQFAGLGSLKGLNLSMNHFNGSIPTNIGTNEAMEQLQLSNNKFQGSIPEELAGFGNLNLIDLSSNELSGNLPSILGELRNLEVLVLSSNLLTGPIPNIFPNLTALSRFAANQNLFTGAIPSGITKFLKNLDLSYNILSGSISDDLFSQPTLQSVDLSYNMLEGPIPDNMSSSLTRVRLGSNSLNATIPSIIWEKLENLVYLELENNSLSGSIPYQLSSCQNLQLLSLAQNQLTGELPTELEKLSQLQVLKLQGNNFIGGIPPGISNLSLLSTLNMSWNSLDGTIPSSLSDLKNLVYLDLQGNRLNGSIPQNIGNMNSLIELQLGRNSLSGSIPPMPSKVLYSLNLSSNQFEGSIPQSFRELDELEILDLSDNKFSGEIPDFLTTIVTLTQLLVANNNLSGPIPAFSSKVTVITKPGNDGLSNSTSGGGAGHPHKRKPVAEIVAVVLAAALIALIVIFSAWVSRRFSRMNAVELQSGEEDAPLPHLTEGVMLTSNAFHKSAIDFAKAMEAVASPSNIELKTRFSTYYKADMPAGLSYFVKKLNWSDKIFQTGSHENFGHELEVLGKLNNSNIMVPLAYMFSTDSAYLFYEYAQKGSLYNVLHGNSGRSALDWASRYSIAVGVAQGLSFLHVCHSGPILLFDLSSTSIMLKSHNEPQIGDIELCKVIDPSKSTGSISTVAGSVGYIPPEYAYTMRITMAGNVYSFGVILLELLTGRPAVSEGTELAKLVLSEWTGLENLDHLLDFSISRTSAAARTQMLSVLKIALACVSFSSGARPKMKSVLRMLLNA